MKDKQAKEIQEEIAKKETIGKAVVNAGKARENYQASGFTPAGDRKTPYEADKKLGEKGNILE